jgi:hypothetical protein
MKSNELRIGNYFLDDIGNDSQYEVITGKHIWDFDDDTIDDYYKPLLLTEEWLLKFGFKKLSNEWLRLEVCKKWGSLYWEALSGFRLTINSNEIQLSHIKYIHQLQNLYFALTGEELKYELE